MKVYDLLDEPTKRLYSYIEDVISDYKIDDISLEMAVTEIIIRINKYNNEKEKDKKAIFRRKNKTDI